MDGKFEGKRSLARPRYTSDKNIKIDFNRIGLEDVD
jgi:hypothetical protein